MWIALVFSRKNTRIHKNRRNSWTFRFGPFFGLVCQCDSWTISSKIIHIGPRSFTSQRFFEPFWVFGLLSKAEEVSSQVCNGHPASVMWCENPTCNFEPQSLPEIHLGVLDYILGGHFGPAKKKICPPPPNSPICRRNPSGPSPPPWRPPPPPGIFSKKTDPPSPKISETSTKHL